MTGKNSEQNSRTSLKFNTTVRVVAAFLLFGVSWIYISDRLLELFPNGATAPQMLQTYKGFLFVLVCALFLAWLLHREERQQAEIRDKLRTTEAHYRMLFESNPNPMWVYDLETLAFLLVNDAAIEKYGYDREEFLRLTLLDIRPAEDAARLRSHIVDRNPLLDFAGEWRHRKKDGAIFPVEIVSHAINFQGRQARLVVAHDISQRKAAEELTRLQTAALEAAANGIVITDTNGTIEWVNPAFTQLTGYTAAEAVSRNPRELVRSGLHDEPFYRTLWDTVLAGSVWRGELTNRRKDGSLYNEEQTITPVRNAAGQLTHFIAIKQDVTARKAAEQTLRENEERYRSLFANNYSIMFLVDPADGQIVDANTAAVRYYGWDAEKLRQMKISQINTLSSPEIQQEMRRAKEQQRNYFNFQHRRADGSIRDVEVYSGPIPYEGRTILYSIVHDITVRKQHERELSAIAELSAALGTASRKEEMLPIILDKVMMLLDVEAATLEVLDPATGDFRIELGRGVWETATGYTIPAGAGLSAQLLVTGKPYLDNDVLGTGHIYYPELLGPCRTIAGAPLAVEGELTGALWIAGTRNLNDADVQILTRLANLAASAIKRAVLNDQLHKQANQLAKTINTVPEGVLLLDIQHNIVLANPLAQHNLEKLDARYHDGALVQLGDIPLQTLLTSPPAQGWHRVTANHRHFEMIARPVESERGLSGWVMVVRDITDALSVQQQLHLHERMAAIGQLAAGIAHDFNNIMSVVVLYAQMMQQNASATDAQRQQLAIIEDQAMRATRMIRQILDFSRRSVLERQQINLLPIVKEQVKLLNRTLPEDIEIVLTYAEGEYLVKADPTRIDQMLTNLAINARDAMPGGGKLRIELDHETVTAAREAPAVGMTEGEWIRMRISDTGSGIAPEVLDHIFEPFFTTKEPGKGTGLGLSQVHGIVGQHEGFITVESTVGAGTTFTIYLPSLVVLVESAGEQQAAAPMAHGNGEHVLIVEDNEQLRQSLFDVLSAWSYQPVAVSNGEEALALLLDQKQPVSLIISDVVMPKLGGVGLVMRLHASGSLPPTILMSGHPMNDEMEVLRSFGPCVLLQKPVSLSELAATMTHLLA